MSGNGPALRWEGVTKSYGEGKALDGFSLEVPRGSVFGLLGRNGSGKTTAIRILLGLLRPGAGRSEVLGEDSLRLPREVRRRIGYLSEEKFPYDGLPLPALVRFVSAFFPSWNGERSARLAKQMGVREDIPLSEMSLGERRRAELFPALAQDPAVLVLDDPWLGLDAAARREFLWVALEAAREEGKTIFLTSHVLTDVERIVDRVAILEAGRVRTGGLLDELKTRTKRLVFESGANGVVIPGEFRRESRGGVTEVCTEAYQPGLSERLREQGHPHRVDDLNLEEVFCAVTGSSSNGGATA